MDTIDQKPPEDQGQIIETPSIDTAIAEAVTTLDVEDRIYQHSLMCMLTLPRSRQEGHEFTRRFGTGILQVKAGSLFNGVDLIQQPIPYGPKARLAMMHICGEAIKTNSRSVDIGGSANAFMKKIGIEKSGQQYKMFRQQMHALAACSLTIGYQAKGRAPSTLNVQPVEHFEAWLTDHEQQKTLFPAELTLSETFFRELQRHAVPLAGPAIRSLSSSALALDLYTFFAYRLHSIESGKLLVPWAMLWEQLGQEYGRQRNFKMKVSATLNDVLKAYPSARVDETADGLILYPSPPPISRLSISVPREISNTPGIEVSPPPLKKRQQALTPKTIESFRNRHPRLDVYQCEADFKTWLHESSAEQPKNFQAAFLGFAQKWAKQNGGY